MAEQVSPTPFYYVHDVYQKNQLETRLYEKQVIPGVNIISGKASVASIIEAGGGGALSPSAEVLGGRAPLRKFLGSKEHLKWLKIDLNAAKVITVQDYKHTKNWCEWKYTYIVLQLRIKQWT